jgi:hypothetical protein
VLELLLDGDTVVAQIMCALDINNAMFTASMTPIGMPKNAMSALRLANQQLWAPNL